MSRRSSKTGSRKSSSKAIMKVTQLSSNSSEDSDFSDFLGPSTPAIKRIQVTVKEIPKPFSLKQYMEKIQASRKIPKPKEQAPENTPASEEKPAGIESVAVSDFYVVAHEVATTTAAEVIVPEEPDPKVENQHNQEHDAGISEVSNDEGRATDKKTRTTARKSEATTSKGKGTAKTRKRPSSPPSNDFFTNAGMMPKAKIKSHLESVGIKVPAATLNALHSASNEYIENFLDQLTAKSGRPGGLFSFSELEKALVAQGLIPKTKNALALEFFTTFTKEQLARMEGLLIPKKGESDTHFDEIESDDDSETSESE